MYKFYLDKQECYHPDKEHPFSYTNIKVVDDMTHSRNLLMVDEESEKMYYSFLFDERPKLSKSNKQHYTDMMEMFFPIIKEDTRKVTYCEVTYEQLSQFLTIRRYNFDKKIVIAWKKLLKSIDDKIKKGQE